MIASLSLKNWRTHKDTTIEFGKGTNLIIGIMGSGKSGMLDGLSYALFGTFPSLKRRDASIGDVVSYGENEARLSISFSSNGKTYRVSRGIKKSGGKFLASAKLYEGENVLETGQGKVTEEVSRILGMDYDLFTRAVYSEQNEIDYFLTIDPGRRKKEMDRLLGLDRFETARSSTVSILNRISSEEGALFSSFDPKEQESLMNGKAEKEKLLETLNAQEALSEKEMASVKEAISSISASLAQLEEKKKKRDLARTSLERAKAKIEAISAELEGKKPSKEKLSGLKESADSLSKQKEALNSELRSIEQEHSSISGKIGNLNSRIESSRAYSDSLLKAEKELAALLSGKPPASFKKLAEEKEAEVVSIASRKESLLLEISELGKVAAAMKPGHPQCPLCGTELGEKKSRHISEEKKQEISARKKELSSLEETLPKSKKELSGLLEGMRRAEYLSEKISELRAKAGALPALEKEKAEAETQLAALKSKKEELSSKREKVEKGYSTALLALKEEENLLRKEESLKPLEEEKQKSESLLSSLEFDDSALEKSRKSFEEARVKEERARSALQMLGKERSSVSGLLSMVEKRLLQIEKIKKESEYLIKLREELTIYKNSLLELQSELRAEMTGAISSAMNEIWPVLYPYADYKQIRITGTEKDYFFEVYDGEWRRLEKVASGGERACLSLTLRIALSTVLTPGVGWMMLDEPTHNLDRDAVHTLSEALETRVPEIIPQSIVITHEENLMSSEFARSYKFSRDKELGGPTTVETL